MPFDNSPYLAAIRTSPYQVTGCYISWFVGTPIASGDITATPDFPTQALTVSYSVGSEADVQRGMLVKIINGNGDVAGVTHVREAGALTSSSLPIRELSNAKIVVESGFTFEVVEEYRLVDKLTAADETFSPDGLSYSDQNLHPPPVACSGGHWAGEVDRGGSFATVANTGGSLSYLVDPASSTAVTHLWTLPSGIAFKSGSANTDANPTFEVDPGRWVVYHDVTDPDNGKTTRQAITYVCDDGSNTYRAECIATVDGTGSDNDAADFSASVELMQAVAVASIPIGALAVVYVHERVGVVTLPVYRSRSQGSGRTEILFAGYVRSVSGTDGAGIGDGDKLTIQLISPLARLREMTSYSKYMVEAATPAAWSELYGLTVKRAYIQIIQFYTRLIESGWDFSGGAGGGFTDYPYKSFTLQKSNFLDQILELAAGDDARFVIDPQGNIDIQTHPALIPLDERDPFRNDLPFTTADIYDGYTVEWSEYETVESCRVIGVTQGDDPQPVRYIYPGNAPGMGTDAPTVERCIFGGNTTTDAERAGRHGGRFEQVFVDADGARMPIPTLTVKMPGVYSYLYFAAGYALFDLPNARGIDLTLYDFYPTRLSFQVNDSGDMDVSATFVGASNAPAAEQEVIDIVSPPPPPDDPVVVPITNPVFPGATSYAVQKMALICASGLARTLGFQSGSVNYNDYRAWGSFSVAVTGTVLLWCPDGYAPGSGWLFTTTKIYYLTIATRVSTLLHTWSSTLQSVSADASWGAGRGFVLAVGYIAGGGTIAAHATDGVTFTETTVNTAYATDGAGYGIVNGCYVSWRTAGKAYTSAFTATGSLVPPTVTSAGKQTGDFGATWGSLSSPTITTSLTLAATIHVPVDDNPTESIAYYTNIPVVSAPGDQRLYRAYGASVTNVSPNIGGDDYAPRVARDGIATAINNRQRVFTIAQNETTSTYAGFLSNDAGDSWSVFLADGTNGRRIAIAGDTQSIGWVWGISNYIQQIEIGGASVTFHDKSGNLSGYSPGEIIAIAGW